MECTWWLAATDRSFYTLATHFRPLFLPSRRKKRNTPLHVAAEKGHRDLIEPLIQAGANTKVIFLVKNMLLYQRQLNRHESSRLFLFQFEDNPA